MSTVHTPLVTPFTRLSNQFPEGSAPYFPIVNGDAQPKPTKRFQLPTLKYLYNIITLNFLSRPTKDILKCVLAYFIGSLFTFVPELSAFISGLKTEDSALGASASAHMVATIAVYYNPAKTVGAMMEADIFCITASLFTAVCSLLAMGNFWVFEVLPGWEWLADVFILLWIGSVMSVVAFAKLWMNKASFNPACSMAVVTLSIVVIREGGLETLLRVLFIIFIGTLISNVVCFLLWPESAVTRLQNNMSKSLVSLSTLLRVIGESFLAGNDQLPDDQDLAEAVSGYQAVFTKLKAGLGEAKSEWADPRLLQEGDYEAAIEGFTRLAQHMTGLRDGAKIRNELRARKIGEDGKLEHVEDNAGLAVFDAVQRELSLPMNALIEACCVSLRSTSEVFERDAGGVILDFTQMAEDIEDGLDTFVNLSNQTVLNLYRGTDLSATQAIESRARNEAVFNVYFFIFTLQEFAKETNLLLEAMNRIWNTERRLNQETILGSRTLGRMVHILGSCSFFSSETSSEEKIAVSKKLRKRMSILLSKDLQPQKDMFPSLHAHTTNTAQTPARETLPWYWRLKQTLWAWGDRMKQPDVKYALKTGMAAMLLASPAFFESTRQGFLDYKGEWALISFFVVMGPTIGATNALGLQRILGTLLGAFVAGLTYALFPNEPILLAILGALYAVPCFWLVVKRPKHATSARFILLTYNLTCLYAYNSRTRDIGVEDIAIKRSLSVIMGVVWAFVVSRWWWPLEARRQLGISLSDFCQEIGWLYTRLVRTYSIPPRLLFPQQSVTQPTSIDQAPLMNDATYVQSIEPAFNNLELHLQMKLIELQQLLSHTANEPRLKGPFPVKLYRQILTSLQIILDKLHSMRCVTMREEWFAAVHRDFIMPVQRERREMVGNVILYFATLSAAFRLKSPLPPYMPPAEQSRLRLIEALRSIDTRSSSKDSRHLLYYAYASSMQGVIQELERLGRTLQDAFGVIGDSTAEFEVLFDNSRLESAVNSPPT
ncbi:hypothetical protein DACRYDRAFT_76995 [Dacryopinax primogenitus]|uniref:Uncharacterized protein n=1 Tax=Dacryopinax primogenitus (strain DJM 731) TaxID=1858805 RepID=M5G8L1_DACPD|nr:uncharacterized protein DACRYDRAFT_76995 [Dacryopinax primogenitus]EJU04510.1 hypothetical protein DACRYDRAFT_76995 [Dacryopinax primogenitus]